MAFTDLLPFGKKKTASPDILPVLPQEIYQSGVLDLQDVIAPHALKISSHELDLRKNSAYILRHLIPALSYHGVVCTDYQHGQGPGYFDFHSPDGHQ